MTTHTPKRDHMPITPEQAAALEAEDRHIRAQVQIYEWMERAEQHQAAADYVASLEERSEDTQKTVAMHRADADRALHFAHAWTEAANALAKAGQAVSDGFTTLAQRATEAAPKSPQAYALAPPEDSTPTP